jgi:peptidyl-tRNA hydrolase, PTH1 family
MGLITKLIHIFADRNKKMFAENKILIAGLGNIGDKYAKTRHNAGFICADALSEKHGGHFDDVRFGFVSKIKIKNKTLVILKPSTFMNLSGNAIAHHLNKEKIPVSALLVITDDIALPFEQVRMRKKGGAGGHNGLQNIIDVLGGSDFARIRIGVGSDFSMGRQSDYVLGEWDDEERQKLGAIKKHVCGACEAFSLAGVDMAMNQYNKEIKFE